MKELALHLVDPHMRSDNDLNVRINCTWAHIPMSPHPLTQIAISEVINRWDDKEIQITEERDPETNEIVREGKINCNILVDNRIDKQTVFDIHKNKVVGIYIKSNTPQKAMQQYELTVNLINEQVDAFLDQEINGGRQAA